MEEEDFEKVVHPANEDDDNTNTNDDEGMILMAFFFCARTTKRECLRTNGVKRRGKKRRTFSLLDGGTVWFSEKRFKRFFLARTCRQK